MNSVTLGGRLGQDVEVRYTGSGKAVTDLRVAVNTGFGENKKTEWFTITLWGSLAERAGKEFSKGSSIVVTGRLAVEEYTNKEGVKISKTKVVGNSLGYGEEKTDKAKAAPVQEPANDEPPF